MAKPKAEVYRRILDGLELKKLYVKGFAGQINLDVTPIPKATKVVLVNISSTADFTHKPENQVEIESKWDVVAKDKRSKSEFLNVSVTYCLVLHSKERFTKNFFEFYEKTSLPLDVWPFVREFLNSMTARMNIPPLNLPLFKVT